MSHSADMKAMTLAKKFLNLAIVLVVAFYAGYLVFWDKSKANSNAGQIDMSSNTQKQIDDVVNKHMQDTAKKMMTDQMLRDLREKRALEDAAKIKVPVKENNDFKLPLEKQIHKADLGFEIVPVQKPVEYRELTVAEMSPQQKAEYARAYKENARKGGFLIELDENLEVIKATPIRQPSQSIDTIEVLPSN